MRVAARTRANDQPKPNKKEVVLIVRHEEGRARRGSAVRVDCARTPQARRGRDMDARVQELAALSLAAAGICGSYLLAVALIRLGVLFGQAFIY